MNVQTRERKILGVLKAAENLFREKSVTNPRLSAELLLASALRTDRIKLYLEFDKPLTDSELEDFRSKVRRRLNNEPIQYITGEAFFYGLKFTVNPSVLIPRPETELLVEKALEIIENKKIHKPRILETGTGSGCISISIACSTECIIDATDINDGAIQTAAGNSENNTQKGKVNFIKKDFLSPGMDFSNYDLVISNPPYIPSDEFSTLADEIKNHEPKHALTDGRDGLEFYRRIFSLYNSASKKPAVLAETGDGKKDNVEELAKKFSINNYKFHKDLMGIHRVIEF